MLNKSLRIAFLSSRVKFLIQANKYLCNIGEIGEIPKSAKRSFRKDSRHASTRYPTKIAVVDSTPLVDLYDMEAWWNHTNREKFKGFKLHAVVNQLDLPVRAIITRGNCYDEPFLPLLIEDLETDFVLANAGYNSKQNTETVLDTAAKPLMQIIHAEKGRDAKMSIVNYWCLNVILLSSLMVTLKRMF